MCGHFLTVLFAEKFWLVWIDRNVERCEVAGRTADERPVAFVTKVCTRSLVTASEAIAVDNVFDLRPVDTSLKVDF